MTTPGLTSLRREARRFVGTVEVALGVFTSLAIAFLVQQIDDLAHAESQLRNSSYSAYVSQTLTSAWQYSQLSLWATVLLIVLFIAFLSIPRFFYRRRFLFISVLFSVGIFAYWVLLLFSSMLAVIPSASFSATITPVTNSSQVASVELTQVYSFLYVATYYVVAVDSIAPVMIMWFVAGVVADYGDKRWVVGVALVALTIFWLLPVRFISIPTVVVEWGGPSSLSVPTGPGGCLGCVYNPILLPEFRAIFYAILALFYLVAFTSILRVEYPEKMSRLGRLLEKLER